MQKMIRIWNGAKVVQVVCVHEENGSSAVGAVGGAGHSARVDIELDPWAGLIVDHSVDRSPVDFREVEK